MVQVSVHVQDYENGFERALDELKRSVTPAPACRLLFHVYCTLFSAQIMSDVIRALCDQFPGCQVVGCTVSGAVIDHDYQGGIVISAQVFELPSSRVEARLYEYGSDNGKARVMEILRYVRENPWVKAVELCRTVHSMATSGLCETLNALPQDILVFGGIACAESLVDTRSYIADQSGRVTDKGIIAVYYGGEDLHIKALRMSGWKPIDRFFTVTKAQDNVIKEIDGAPAVDIYRRYLDIRADEHFVTNALEFPLFSQDDGHNVVRNVFSCDEDGALTVAYNVNPGAKLRVCYADAESIAENIHAVSRELMGFTPDVVSIVSCITRSIIWRMKDYMPELQGFKAVAPCHGYLSYGELIREDGVLNHHNTILIATAFREGGLKDISYPEQSVSASTSIPLAVRLSTFISRVTDEWRDMYSEAEQAATTDALTKIGNRYLFDDVVNSVSADWTRAGTKYMLMLDLNGLKFVNDTFGHNEGDALIKAAADAIAGTFSPYGQCFRIGGDEFAVIADFESEGELHRALHAFRNSLRARNSTAVYMLSMAVGYAALVSAQGKLLSASDWKMAADINMYLDKTKFHDIKTDALNRNMSDFIKCVMSLVDNKNPLEAHHAVRVQRMAVMIAKQMLLEDEVIERVNLSAYLHDIGKIGISDVILTKAEPLTMEERRLIRQKPAIGRRLLKTSEETKHIADIVYACEERWDGGGYPERLSGNDIPLEARIIAVADFIDTALHGRYGKAAIPAQECIARLQENSGTLFDPAVAGVALASFGAIVKGDMTL